MEILEGADIKIVYDFDRLHENTPDKYGATSRTDGFQFRFDANQILDVIFIYCLPLENFTPFTSSDDCDVTFFASVDEVDAHAVQENLRVTKGKSDLLGIPRVWARLEYERHSAHYEFRSGNLAVVTVRARVDK